MAIPKIKATYSLDLETVRALEATAARWRVSKSEALRRAIRAVAEGKLPGEDTDPVAALDALQKSLELDADGASRWQESARAERHAYSDRPGLDDK